MSIIFKMEISEAISELRKETYFHPRLRERIIQAMQDGINATTLIFEDTGGQDKILIRSLEEFVGFLAAETGIAMHGIYNQDDLDKACRIIRDKLAERRVTNVSSSIIVGADGNKILH